MTNDVLISVIVAIYNVSEYLRDCLESIIGQTYEKLEIILVDDGSTDGSGKICDELEKLDNRIIVIHKDNEGLVKARKEGLKIANGEYIAFVDGDDYIDKKMYEELMKVAIKSEVDIVNSGLKISNIPKMLSPDFNLVDKNYSEIEIIKYNLLDLDISNRVSHNLFNKLFRKEIVKKSYELVPNYQSFGEDWLCFVACICEKASVISVNRAYYNYRTRSNSLSHEYSINSYINSIHLYGAFVNLFKTYKIYDELKDVMENMLKYLVIDILKKSDAGLLVQKYKFPDVYKLQNKKVVIYGAGVVGVDYYADLSRYKNIEIVAWVDKKYKEKKYEYCEVSKIEKIKEIEYDYVVIANSDKNILRNIYEDLKSMGVLESKIMCTLPILV